ncbi:hypothetical protein HAX54_016615 [Datura stramonium]|uniref:Uncharacterized protein n=1 Tax=Datura stramonium TaxID=4076 RepID=A0ABS8UJ84_DATST|nr:hypothetical protein [Datura stramonium]
MTNRTDRWSIRRPVGPCRGISLCSESFSEPAPTIRNNDRYNQTMGHTIHSSILVTFDISLKPNTTAKSTNHWSLVRLVLWVIEWPGVIFLAGFGCKSRI